MTDNEKRKVLLENRLKRLEKMIAEEFLKKNKKTLVEKYRESK